MKNPITFFLFLVFAFANLVDIATAFFIQPAESNPIFLLFGSLWVVVGLKIFIVWIFYYYTKRNIYPSNFMYYLTIMLLVLGTLLICLGAFSNIWGITHPEVIAEGAAMSASEKVKGYGLMVSIIYLIPALFNIIMFTLYDKSIGKAVIDKEFFHKLKWWKL
jgi:hypothetical protein